MDRNVAMLVLLGCSLGVLLIFLALFAVAPIFCSCLVSLLYTVYVFIANERSGVHHAQEYENRFWTIFTILLSTALFFAKDSPLAFGRWNPSIGFLGVLFCGYGMHAYDRYVHRENLSKEVSHTLRRRGISGASLIGLTALGIPIEEQLAEINSCLSDIDQLLIPSTINNFINQRFIFRKEREIISIFEEAEPKALNYLIAHSRLGLLFYKIKDHRNFSAQHRTELIDLLAVEKISQLTVISRVIVLHALQIMKIPANNRAEHWVKNIILSTKQDDLSELKTLTDAKGDYFCMNKLIYEDVRSETIRQSILNHFLKESKVQQAHMKMKTKKAKLRSKKAWRKVLSDVDDTLSCSGGSFPAGCDKRFGKKVIYPGVLGFYRELDLGTEGPEEWPNNTVGNLVFLSARPHLYKDISEKHNFAKFAKLHARRDADGRGGMHTIPSLLSGDLTSGTEFIIKNDYEPLAQKKFENFKKYVAIYPEFKHVFVCDNGQGDVRAGELMFDSFPQHIEAVFVHSVQSISKTYGYNRERWKKKGFQPFFFFFFPEAALECARRANPLISNTGLRRICEDAVFDFLRIETKQWPSEKHKWDRRDELNQSLYQVNEYLSSFGYEPVQLISSERVWKHGERVRTPYGIARIISYNKFLDLYTVELDWRPLDIQRKDHIDRVKGHSKASDHEENFVTDARPVNLASLETVLETEEEAEEENIDSIQKVDIPPPGNYIDASGVDPESLNTLISEELRISNFVEVEVIKPEEEDKNANNKDQNGEVQYTYHNTQNIEDVKKTKEQSYQMTPVVATLKGRHITKYTLPELPTFPNEKETRSAFSFWNTTDDMGKSTKTKTKSIFNHNDKCSTPFGAAIVVDYRQDTSVVVVNFMKWSARGYLQEKDVENGGSGFFTNFFKRVKAKESEKVLTKGTNPKEVEIQFVKGSIIQTPFGLGEIVRPLTLNDAKFVDEKKLTTINISTHNDYCNRTVGISLTSWVMINNSNPMLYCTASVLEEWKQGMEDEKSKEDTGGILSVFGNIVSQSIQMLKLPTGKKNVPSEILVPLEERYYKDGAAVTTLFGDGLVLSYREADSFYVVSLIGFGSVNKKNVATAYLRKESLNYRLAQGCHEGYPVLISFGLTGILASVEPTTGVHIVTVSSAGMVCYLQPQDVIRPLKAAVGEDVLTPYGEGNVKKYRIKDDMYEVTLTGNNLILFCKGESFDRVKDSLEDQGSFGLNFLLRYLFHTDKDKPGDSRRSRSSSVGSLSGMSLSGRSII